MKERLQKIIARAGIASRRHAEQLILSGQVRVNGRVVTELGTKADPAKDKIEASGREVKAEERHVYLVLHKPAEVVSTLADPEGRKTLRNLLRGFPERVYPVGNLEYNAAGLVFLTNDGDLAAELLKKWSEVEQVYHAKVKGMLTLADLARIGQDIGAHLKTLRQPDASRRRAHGRRAQVPASAGRQKSNLGRPGQGAGNYWYEVRMRDSRKDALRQVLAKEQHPLEKLRRVGLVPLTLEGLPPGRYRLLEKKEVEEFRHSIGEGKGSHRGHGGRALSSQSGSEISRA